CRNTCVQTTPTIKPTDPAIKTYRAALDQFGAVNVTHEGATETAFSRLLAGIPPEVFEYRLGNRSALEWVIDQYSRHRGQALRHQVRSEPRARSRTHRPPRRSGGEGESGNRGDRPRSAPRVHLVSVI